MFSSLDDLKLFREEGIFNYSTILMRDDLGVLLLGAREAIYALDINNISVRKSVVRTRDDNVFEAVVLKLIIIRVCTDVG